jgi:hypothetical protein
MRDHDAAVAQALEAAAVQRHLAAGRDEHRPATAPEAAAAHGDVRRPLDAQQKRHARRLAGGTQLGIAEVQPQPGAAEHDRLVDLDPCRARPHRGHAGVAEERVQLRGALSREAGRRSRCRRSQAGPCRLQRRLGLAPGLVCGLGMDPERLGAATDLQ